MAGARAPHYGGAASPLTIIGIPFAWAHLKLAGIVAVADRQDDRSGLPGG